LSESVCVADEEILYRAIVRVLHQEKVIDGALQAAIFLVNRKGSRGIVCVDQKCKRPHEHCYALLKKTFEGKTTPNDHPLPLFQGAVTIVTKIVRSQGVDVLPHIENNNPYHAYVNMSVLSEEDELTAAQFFADNCCGKYFEEI